MKEVTKLKCGDILNDNEQLNKPVIIPGFLKFLEIQAELQSKQEQVAPLEKPDFITKNLTEQKSFNPKDYIDIKK